MLGAPPPSASDREDEEYGGNVCSSFLSFLPPGKASLAPCPGDDMDRAGDGQAERISVGRIGSVNVCVLRAAYACLLSKPWGTATQKCRRRWSLRVVSAGEAEQKDRKSRLCVEGTAD